jgi:hypothetical protein
MGFSYYKLLSSYSGNCVKVRRSSDNTEQDFGFKNGYIDSNAIATFCGAGSGYVTTWYNQYVTGNNLTQTSNDIQPRIVNDGTFEVNGLRSIAAGTIMYANFYAEINIKTPPMTLYCNEYNLGTRSSYTLFFGSSSSVYQHALTHEINGISYYKANNTSVITANSQNTGNIKKHVTWNGTGTNQISYTINGAVTNGTLNSNIDGYTVCAIFTRIPAGGNTMDGNIKTIVMANKIIDYSVFQNI